MFDRLNKKTEEVMFDMQEVGNRIATLRKSKDMTQQGLADKLGISFQAVSNWERGESMPDISKLVELAQILDVSVDELLGSEPKKSQSFESTVTVKNGERHIHIDTEGIALSDKMKQLLRLVPFVGKGELDELLLANSHEYTEVDQVIAFSPFVSEQTLLKIVSNCSDYDSMDTMIKLAPFLSKKTSSELVKTAMH